MGVHIILLRTGRNATTLHTSRVEQIEHDCLSANLRKEVN